MLGGCLTQNPVLLQWDEKMDRKSLFQIVFGTDRNEVGLHLETEEDCFDYDEFYFKQKVLDDWIYIRLNYHHEKLAERANQQMFRLDEFSVENWCGYSELNSRWSRSENVVERTIQNSCQS